jgi:putative transposase
LREAELPDANIGTIARAHGISEQTFYRWRAKFHGLESDQAARLTQLERENLRLKKLLAERDLEVEIMKEINSKKW